MPMTAFSWRSGLETKWEAGKIVISSFEDCTSPVSGSTVVIFSTSSPEELDAHDNLFIGRLQF